MDQDPQYAVEIFGTNKNKQKSATIETYHFNNFTHADTTTNVKLTKKKEKKKDVDLVSFYE